MKAAADKSFVTIGAWWRIIPQDNGNVVVEENYGAQQSVFEVADREYAEATVRARVEEFNAFIEQQRAKTRASFAAPAAPEIPPARREFGRHAQ